MAKQTGREIIGDDHDDNRANQLNPKHPAYWKSRGYESIPETSEGMLETSDESGEKEDPETGDKSEDGDKTEMTEEDARRIQRAVDKDDGDEGFKSRAMSAAAKKESEE